MQGDPVKLLVSIAAPLLAGFLGSVFTRRSVETWYATISKPSFNPPSGVFGPVWTALYVLMGIAAFLIWRRGLADPRVRTALIFFLVQLALNAFWSLAFFGMRSPLAGAVVISALWVAILLTMITFFKISSAAGLMLAPYILWVGFASILNFSIYFLNR